MRSLYKSIVSVFLSVVVLSGCSTAKKAPTEAPAQVSLSSQQEVAPENKASTPAPVQQSTDRVGELILVWVAGYCEGWTKATGEDFERCVDTTVDFTMKEYREKTGVKAGKLTQGLQ